VAAASFEIVCCEGSIPAAGKVDRSKIFAALFATFFVALRLSPMNRTSPSTERSSTTRPSRVTNWM
jgi:hypothetical protein